MTRFVGLTGGIGAGKSEALAAFERQGAATLSTNHVAHDPLHEDEVGVALVERWGEEIAPHRRVDRDVQFFADGQNGLRSRTSSS